MKSKEDLLIEYFGMGHLIRVVPTIDILQMIGRKCFIADSQSIEVDSLRRCLKAIDNCNPSRGTKEYENLIEFSPQTWVHFHFFKGD